MLGMLGLCVGMSSPASFQSSTVETLYARLLLDARLSACMAG
jgi:hypothetical protein